MLTRTQFVVTDGYPDLIEDMMALIEQQSKELDKCYKNNHDEVRVKQNNDRYNDFVEWVDERKEACKNAEGVGKIISQQYVLDVLTDELGMNRQGDGLNPSETAKEVAEQFLKILEGRDRVLLSVIRHLDGHFGETPDSVIVPDPEEFDMGRDLDSGLLLQKVDNIVRCTNIPISMERQIDIREQIESVQQASDNLQTKRSCGNLNAKSR